MSASSIISPPASIVASPVPDDATVIAALEPFDTISFVIKLSAVTPSLNVEVPVTESVVLKLPEVAVIAPVVNAPAVTEIALDLSAAVAVVVPITKLSVSSFQIIAALFPAVPLSIIIPALFVFADAPVFNSIILSSIVVFVVLTVVDEPPTVKLPLTLTFKLSNVIVFDPDPEFHPSPAVIV